MRFLLGDAGNRCAIAPAAGGSLAGWWIGGQAMVRAAPDSAVDPLDLSGFPLVPFSNRIGQGRFEWAGETVALALNLPPEPHTIHGLGWQRPWSVVESGPWSATLALTHGGDALWPWPFEATQRFTLDAESLTIAMSVWNRADRAVPLCIGHHPYFDSDGATLAFAARQVWQTGPDGLPSCAGTPTGQFDFAAGAAVAGRRVDNGYAGLSGAARIGWRGRPMALEIVVEPALAAAVVYIPPDGDAFCFEPVAHVINAINLPGAVPAMPVIEPGTAHVMTIRFRAVSAG